MTVLKGSGNSDDVEKAKFNAYTGHLKPEKV
jgi:hypothetical protein